MHIPSGRDLMLFIFYLLLLTVCPGAKDIYTDSQGIIDYPEGNNLNCTFTIQAPESIAIKYRFLQFDFDYENEYEYDWLTIYDANDMIYGYDIPPTDWTTTETNVLILHMNTDSTNRKIGLAPSIGARRATNVAPLLQTNRKKGFVMEWRFTL